MGITSGRTIKPRRAESSKPKARLVRKRPRCTPCTAREPDYISTEEIDARPDIIPDAKGTPALRAGCCRRIGPIGFSMRRAWLSSPTTRSFDWNDRAKRGEREIEFSSFPPVFLPFSFSHLLSIFFPLSYDAYMTETRIASSCYHTGVALDSRTFGVTITANGRTMRVE